MSMSVSPSPSPIPGSRLLTKSLTSQSLLLLARPPSPLLRASPPDLPISREISRLSSPTSPAGRFAKLAKKKKSIAERNVADSRSSSEKSGRLVDPCCSHTRSPLSVTALLPCKTPALNQKVAAPACWHKFLSPLLLWQGPGLAQDQKGLCLFPLRLFVIPIPPIHSTPIPVAATACLGSRARTKYTVIVASSLGWEPKETNRTARDQAME